MTLEFENKGNGDFSRFKEICRDAGLKLTHQRLEIFKELSSAHDHPSVETLYHRVKLRVPTIALDTVYRTLASLERAGAIQRVYAFDDLGRFDADVSDHHHFVCEKCRRIFDFSWPKFHTVPLPEEVEELGRVNTRQVLFRGTCRSCLNSEH